MLDIELAIAAAHAGAEVVRTRFGGPLTRTEKGAGDLVTDVDFDAEKAILEVLVAHRPADRFVAEEAGEVGSTSSDRCWLIDPLCGTFNFAAGTGPVAVNVALCDRDGVVVAAIADPLGGVVDWTDGVVACRRSSGRDCRLTPTADSRLVDLNLDPPLPNSARFTTARLLSDPEFGAQFRPRVVSTSLALAWVASGQRAGYVTDGDRRGSVHFTAAIALCEAANCVVTNLEGGEIHTGVGGVIAAADRPTHNALTKLTRRQFLARK